MSIPHLSLLQKISDLEQKTVQLESDLLALQSKLDTLKTTYDSAKKSEYSRLLEIYTQEKTLLQIQQEVSELRDKEKELKSSLKSQISTHLDSFLARGGILKLVQDIVKKENLRNQKIVVLASKDMVEKIGDLEFQEISGHGVLRLKSEHKTYVLDTNILIPDISEKLFIKLLSA
jgi:predicted ribonuclease YlaK